MIKGEVGKSAKRVDALKKLTGQAIYPDDIVMENMAYGVTLRSAKPHAHIKIDISQAEKVDGVIKVLTYKDVIGANHHGVLIKDHEILCEKKVRRVGDPLAFVVAESEEIAKAALVKIKVEYEELQAVFSPIEAMKDDATKIHDEDSNINFHYKSRTGDTESAFKECDVIVENEYTTSMVDHVFLQPEAGVSYLEEDGTVVLKTATQYAHFDRFEVAEALGISEEKVKIINTEIGGAFGGREDISLQIHLALATYLTDAVMAQDVGRAINPNLIEGQMDGGFVMGYSYAIYEDLGLRDGHIKNNKLSKYLVPTSLDTINIKKIIVEDPESTAPFGAKGIGEPVMVHVAPAILNAIYDATGVRMTEIPVTPEKLLKAISEK